MYVVCLHCNYTPPCWCGSEIPLGLPPSHPSPAPIFLEGLNRAGVSYPTQPDPPAHTILLHTHMDASLPLHSKIAWAGQAGFPGARYCCICSYSTRDKPVTPCTEENCPNSACRECFSDADFNCSQTADIRVTRGFSRPVTYEVNTPTIPESEEANGEELTHEQEEETEDEVIQHLISSSTKEELATRLVLLQGEYKKQELIIKSDDSADRNSEATTSVSYRDSGTQAKEGESRENNCHLPNAGENCNIGGNKSGNNNRRIGNRQQQSRQRATRTRQQQEVHHHPPTAQHRLLSLSNVIQPARQLHLNRPAKQHRPPPPPKGHGEEPVCSYCSRRGHTIKDCKTRAAEQRQEHLRRVIAEVRQPIPSSHRLHLDSYISCLSLLCGDRHLAGSGRLTFPT
ncbi:hypothetical protein Pcinc_027897 [Petrolisthes cinctipes]|uniref:CCHC-type domain-containing protein n=1 Tax=Petrolisthes cinctipes TaxID=88211 RepID=A0AAE1F451_PETCI|nr:hypothetical protein Pcinc_027897 [Petrolisthes cinctipes]